MQKFGKVDFSSIMGVRRQGDRIILVKLVVGDMVLNVISAYVSK